MRLIQPLIAILTSSTLLFGGSSGTIVQEGSLSGTVGHLEQDLPLAQFDDQGGTLRLDSVDVELAISLIGGGVSTGTGGQPTRVIAQLDASLLLQSQALVVTQATLSGRISNSGPPKTFTLFDSDSDQVTLTGGALAPWVGTGQIVLKAVTDFVVEETGQNVVSFSAGGSVRYKVTYGYSSLSATTFVEEFEGGSNEGLWSWGTGNQTISPTNGNPGAFLEDLTLSTCCPIVGTEYGDESEFTGNYRLQEVSSVGIDIITLAASSGVGGRPLSVILVDDNGTPFDFDDDALAFFVGDTNIPDPGVPGLTPAGWTSYDFDIPSGSTTLPPGWETYDSENGVGASDEIWNRVITDVDELEFQYGDPKGIYLFLSWDVGLDNPRIVKSGLAPLAAAMDVRPGACPNPFNPLGRGALDVALIGSATLDVTQVDVTTLALSRADGVGGSVDAYAGPSGPGSRLVDVAAPSGVQPCECGPAGTDGVLDLLAFFASDELASAMQLDGALGGTAVPLVLSGALLDGTPFGASDCVTLYPLAGPPKGVGLSVLSSVPDAWIEVDAGDLNGDSSGFASFDRTYPAGTLVTLTAPPNHGEAVFAGWLLTETSQVWARPALTLDVGTVSTVQALYFEPYLQGSLRGR